MPNQEKDIEWIDNFLKGKLSESEVVTFQKRLAEEATFADLFEEAQLIATGIRLNGLTKRVRHFQALGKSLDESGLEEETIGQAIRYERNMDVLERFKERGKELDEVAASVPKKGKLTSYLFNRYTSVAAVLLLLVTFWWANGNYSNVSIIEDLNEPFLNYQQAGTTQDYNEVMKEGKNAFFNKDYNTAIGKFLTISNQHNDIFYEAQGLLAYTYFNNRDYSKAINQFNLLINDYYDNLSIDYKDKNRLRWTRLLAYLGNNQEKTPFFIQELDFFLQNKSEKYQKKAELLQSKIDSNWRKLPFFK